jgi:NOL1/NOP2/sun family putative RNA methylase
MKFKEKFIEKYSKLIDFEEYKESVIRTFARKSIRINTLGYSVSEVKKSLERDGWNLKQIPWCKNGFFIEHSTGRRDIGNTKQHKKGMFFSQGAPSMIPCLLMGISGKAKVIDLCAAPGGKTHHLACLMNNKGYLVANEPNTFRSKILKMNLERCGVNNFVLDFQKGEDYINNEKFDAILIDAPCTGSGLIKGKIARTKKLLKEWNPKIVNRYAKIQRKMLESASKCLRKHGRIVYSTCSMEPEEDELLIDSFLKDHDELKLVKAPRVSGYRVKSSLKDYIKVWPQYYDTNGFFVAVMEKR